MTAGPCRRLLLGLWAFCTVAKAAPPDGPAQVPGRLFTTPEQRAMLDRLRATPPKVQRRSRKAAASERAVTSTGPKKPVAIGGIVQRSQGPNTVWVDAVPLTEGGVTQEGIRVEPAARPAGEVYLRAPDAQRRVGVKPGQRYDPVKGLVTESFER